MQIASRISAMAASATPPGPSGTPTQISVYGGNGRKVGIYSATAVNSSIPTIIDWGDGTTDSVVGNISQLVHTYTASPTSAYFTIEISDNISSLAMGDPSMAFQGTTTNNSTQVTNVTLSPSITSIPDSGFDSFYRLFRFNAGTGGNLTMGTWTFYQAGRTSAFDIYAVRFDFSGRTMTSIPSDCFYEAGVALGLFGWPQGLTTIEGGAFYGTAISGGGVLLNFTIPEGVTTIGWSNASGASQKGAFESCNWLANLTLPSSLTYINRYAFRSSSKLATITCNALAAPSQGTAIFGSTTSNYTGRNSYSAGTNRLYVPTGATGYTSGQWADPLCSSSKCGFTLEYV